MIKKRIGLSVLIFLSALAAPPARAGTNANAKIVVHVAAPAAKNACSPSAAPSCAGVVTAGTLAPASWFAYALAMEGDAAAGFRGVQFGIDYDGTAASGVDVHSWTLCGTLQFPEAGWPASGTGNLVTWNNCLLDEPGGPGTGVVAVAGYFYITAYTDDTMRIRPRPADNAAKVADCGFSGPVQEVWLPGSALGTAAFSAGGTGGYNPCGLLTAVECSIAGPVTVDPGVLNSYAAQGAPAGAVFQWSVSGNGTIIGGSSGSTVQIEAGAIAGSYTVSLELRHDGAVVVCSSLVIVNPPAPPPPPLCSIAGSTTAHAQSTQVYEGPDLPGMSWNWSVTGNASITGPADARVVTMAVGTVGAFQLRLTTVSGSDVTMCEKDVSVTPLPPGNGTQQNAKILVHVAVPTTNNQCERGLVACVNARVSGGLYPPNLYFAFILASEGNSNPGIGAVQFGIQYDNAPQQGVDVFEWHPCGATEEPSTGWPASGGGNLIRWAECRKTEPGGTGTGTSAVAGYFYIGAYSPDYLAITTHPTGGQAVVYDCPGAPSAITGFPPRLGQAAFGLQPVGYNPCGFVTPVENTTWSAIKSMMNR